MADDWDLYAVVRGCKSTTRNITITAAGIAPTKPIHTPPDEFKNDPLWDLLSSDELTDPLLSFTNLDDPKEANGFQELQQSFFRNPTTTTTTTTNNNNNNDHDPTTRSTTFGPNNIIPNSPTISDFGGSSGSGQHHLQHKQQQQHHAQLQQQQLQQQQHLSMPTNFTRGIPAPGFQGIYGQQQQIMQPGDKNLQPQQLQTQRGFKRPKFINPAYLHPRLPTRSQRRRKTQQKKNVHEVKAEDLSSDLWAWRKYGQKPIKGSPHPRNYYRCSSSKGCPARRQVERSTTEPNIFVVTYTGDHTHARPTHRNSLAGSSRNKLLAASTSQKQPINNDSGSTPVPNPSSPTTGLPMTVQAEAVPVANKVNSDNSLDKENEEFDEEEETDHENENENEVEDDDVVIPDMDMSDEIFLGLKELGGTSSNGSGSGSSSLVCASGDNFSDNGPSSLESSWAAANCWRVDFL